MNGSEITKYITAADMKIAQIKGADVVSYYHKDHLNSSTVMTNASGGELERTNYAPYGTARAFTGTLTTNYRYTGKELDAETGLYYYGARYYDPMIGRFISADSIVSDYYDPQDLNRYAYARNNPMKYVDPDGHVFKVATVLFRGGYALYKGYNLYSTVSGMVEDTQTIFTLDPKVGTGERLLATASLIADVSGVKDVVGAAKGMYKGGNAVVSVVEDVRKSADIIKHGSNIPHVKKSAEIGQEAHRQLEVEGADRWLREQKIILPGGEVVRKDGISISNPNKVRIIKPDTKSGHKAAEKRAALMEKHGYETQIDYYNPSDPRFEIGSPTYIGPKQ